MTLDDVRAVRDLPGMSSSMPSVNDVTFDPAIRSYRSKKTGLVLRDSVGKKVATEDQLVRLTNSTNSPAIGTGTKVALTTLGIIYLPIAIVFGVAEWVLSLPAQPFLKHLANVYPRTGEEAYSAGRQHFAAGDFAAALDDWERARTAMPNLQAFSDIEYWRGRAFEGLGDSGSAHSAYRTFLEYSESVVPANYKDKKLADGTWAERAGDADERLRSLQQNARQ